MMDILIIVPLWLSILIETMSFTCPYGVGMTYFSPCCPFSLPDITLQVYSYSITIFMIPFFGSINSNICLRLLHTAFMWSNQTLCILIVRRKFHSKNVVARFLLCRTDSNIDTYWNATVLISFKVKGQLLPILNIQIMPTFY